MSNDDKPLTPAEVAEMKRNQEILRQAYADDPQGTLAALRDAYKDMRDFPAQNGDVRS